MVECADGSLYTGATNDLARRVDAHNRGRGARYTRSRLPVRLVFSERCVGKGPALSREAALKRLPREHKLRLVAATRPPRRRRARKTAATRTGR